MHRFLYLIRNIVYAPFVFPSLCAYCCTSKSRRDKINQDIEAYWKHTRGKVNRKYVSMLYNLLIVTKEFRNVFYVRLGVVGRLLPIFLKPISSLFIAPSLSENYEGGLYIAHGTSVQIYANKIGKNLWMHHNVTLGMKGNGRPEIGDNVYIGTGAVIIGGVKIGNNARIGANATVVDDVPDNAVVVSPKAKVIKIIQLPTEQMGGGKCLTINSLNAA